MGHYMSSSHIWSQYPPPALLRMMKEQFLNIEVIGMNFTVVTYGIVPLLKTIVLS